MPNPLHDALLGPHRGNDRPFIETDAGAWLSFADIAGRTAQIANLLVARGLKPGDRVAVQAPKLPETLALYLASVQAGGVYLPLNTAYTLDELGYFLADAAPAVVVCEGRDAGAIGRLAGAAAVLTLDADGTGSLAAGADLQRADFPTVPRGPDDLAALLYTSGTTGRSKGAMLSHRNLVSNAAALVGLWRITEADTLIHALPIFHTHGLFVAVNTALIAGARLRFMAKFDLDAIFAALPGATMLMGVPTFYTRLLGDPRLTRAATAHMRLFVSGCAPLLAETHAAFAGQTGHQILERYGMTETNMIASNPYEGARVPGTVGFAIGDTEVKITDPGTGEALPPGRIGMIEVRGPNVFRGYWQMPQKTREELREDGYFLTGDLGVMDGEGRLAIVGRQKDLIISGGYNVYPKEIEEVLNRAPGVRESAVYGVPDADLGEAVAAAVVLEPGTAADAEALAAFVKAKLARFKQPKSYAFVPDLPRNAMGKVQKALLRDRAKG